MTKKKVAKKKATRRKVTGKIPPKTQEKSDAGKGNTKLKDTDELFGSKTTTEDQNQGPDSFSDESLGQLDDSCEDDSRDDSFDNGYEEMEVPENELREYTVYTMEGTYVYGQGDNKITDIYKEEFVLKESSESVARSKIVRFLLDSRLKSKVKFYKRYRTHVIIDSRFATSKDLKDVLLKSDDIMSMSLAQLSYFSLQENLSIDSREFLSVNEARFTVREAFKSGRKSRAVYDSTRRPLGTEVNPKTNKPL